MRVNQTRQFTFLQRSNCSVRCRASLPSEENSVKQHPTTFSPLFTLSHALQKTLALHRDAPIGRLRRTATRQRRLIGWPRSTSLKVCFKRPIVMTFSILSLQHYIFFFYANVFVFKLFETSYVNVSSEKRKYYFSNSNFQYIVVIFLSYLAFVLYTNTNLGSKKNLLPLVFWETINPVLSLMGIKKNNNWKANHYFKCLSLYFPPGILFWLFIVLLFLWYSFPIVLVLYVLKQLHVL